MHNTQLYFLLYNCAKVHDNIYEKMKQLWFDQLWENRYFHYRIHEATASF